MYSNILIPVSLDHSRDVDASLKVAKALADKNATFTLLHVVEPVPTYVSQYVPHDYLEHNREKMTEELEELAKALPNARIHLATGRAGSRISRWADENGSDCIVIASHEPEIADYLLGSTAQHVVRHTKCAVHIVR